MLAVRWHANRDVRLEEVEWRGQLGAGMVEAEVRFCGICGSDVAEWRDGPFAIRHTAHPLTGHSAPVTLGHEFAGRVTATGDEVRTLRVGDRVAADGCWRCGVCQACVSGGYNLCAVGGAIGLHSDGALAGRVRFPAYCAVALPDAVSDRAGALLEPYAVALHALDRVNARPGTSAAVLGFGPIGAAVAELAAVLGLECVVVEPTPGRRHRAREFGHRTVERFADPRETVHDVRSLTDGGAEVAVDASGAASALPGAIEMTRRGGRIALAGIAKQPVEISCARLVLYERSLVGALGYTNDLPRIAKMIAAGRLDPERTVTRTVPLSSAPAEIARLGTDPGDDIKVLVEVGAA
jgi:(R,R)-butanediol dehydrogenase/meso-butanediol dehydrogenase/diacetyl reductase